MVSKVAVMALVAIIAAPILLGYAFNISEVAVTDYKPDGESVNVTQLLQTGTAYTYVNSDIYRLNTDFEDYNGLPMMPRYQSVITNASPLQMYQTAYTISPGTYQLWYFDNFTTGLYVFVGKPSTITFYDLSSQDGTTIYKTVNNLVSFYYDAAENTAVYSTQYQSSSFTPHDVHDYAYFRNDGASDITIYYSAYTTKYNNYYVDFSGGFKFSNIGNSASNSARLNLPQYTKSALMTIDFDAVAGYTDYSFKIEIGLPLLFTKTTTDRSRWTVTNLSNNEVVADDIYMNPAGNNTYQLFVDLTPAYTETYGGHTYYHKNHHVELRYVGAWPTLIGAANYYQKYEYDWLHGAIDTDYYIDYVKIGSTSGVLATTPTLRMDEAQFRGMAYSIISDKTYTPSDFKTNPTTTLTVNSYGSSIDFAGNTYTVDSSGNITLGTHKVSVNGLKLESIPVAVGYENKINGYVISVTANPSTIKFNGEWGASVSTVANAATTYTKTEWTPGEFAWDGIDDNFLIVGLIVSFAAFVGLAIYSRRSKTSLWPLLLVCGGATMLFLFML